jgi:hypothetical protein
MWEPFAEATPLPDGGSGYERATLDLKLEGQAKPGFHMAKDVAKHDVFNEVGVAGRSEKGYCGT